MAGMSEAGHGSYYMQDEMGSPMLLADEEKEIRESYAFIEFGQSLHHTPEGQLQPFGYTGYQVEPAHGACGYVERPNCYAYAFDIVENPITGVNDPIKAAK